MPAAPPSLQAGRDAARDGRYADARRAFQAAADLGDAEGFYELGLLHRDGRGLPKSPERALTLFRSAAKAGCAGAQYELALCLAQTDKAEAERWLSRAAKTGHAAAMTRLADLFGERDPHAAHELLARAAQQGHRPAMIGYGHVLAAGMGGPRDRVEAVAWLCAAAAIGSDPELERDTGVLAGALSPRQFATAQRRGRAILKGIASGQAKTTRAPAFPVAAWFKERLGQLDSLRQAMSAKSDNRRRRRPLTRSPAAD
jgi:TPR repeat protein